MHRSSRISDQAARALLAAACLAGAVAFAPAMAGTDSLSGKVRSILLDERFDTEGSAYHLLVEGRDADPHWQTVVRNSITRTLADRAFGPEKPLLAADVAIVVRFGSQADKADVDAILAGADPDTPLDTGTRFLRIEAYDMNGYLAFSEQLADQGPEADVADFMLWVTTVSSPGAVDELPDVLPHMIAQATTHLSTETSVAFTADLP